MADLRFVLFRLLVFPSIAAASLNVTAVIDGGGPKGRLLASWDNTTVTVSGDGSEPASALAKVVCRELGWNTTRPRVFIGRCLPPAKGVVTTTVMYLVQCTGNENSMADCSYSFNHAFAHSDTELGIDCSDASPNVTHVAIEGGGRQGRLIVTADGQTGTVYSKSSSSAVAAVVCRELGWNTTWANMVSLEDSPNFPIVMDVIQCTGKEDSLADCEYATINCSSASRNVGIDCLYGNVTVAIEGGGSKGRLLAIVDGRMGTVCKYRATSVTAEVVCRELGWNTTRAQLIEERLNSTAMANVMNTVRCTGSERSLADCRYSTFINNCNFHGDVGIDCSYGFPNITVAIQGGGDIGTLRLTVNGETRSVCSDGLTNAFATVVCRQLGLNTTRARIMEGPLSRFGVVLGTGDLQMHCTGNENHLAYCYHQNFSCAQNQPFGIDCSDGNVTIAIEGGSRKGRLLATINGETGLVCPDGSTQAVAAVICRELGWNATQARTLGGPWHLSRLPIVLDDVRCDGSENRVADCTYYNYVSCSGYGYEFVMGIDCSDGLTLCDADGILEVVENTTDNVFTCTGFDPGDTMTWGFEKEDGTTRSSVKCVNIIANSPLACDNRPNSPYLVTRLDDARSTVTVDATSVSMLDEIQGSTVICESSLESRKKFSDVRCRMDLIAVPSVTCDAHYYTQTSSPWTVSAKCSVLGAYSYLNRYTCKLVPTSPSNASLDSVNMTMTSSRGKYKSGYCEVFVPFPNVTGVYSYTMLVIPGKTEYAVSLDIRRPNTAPRHNCAENVTESQDSRCMCTAADLGQPAGVVRWTSTRTSLLLLGNVQKNQSGTEYSCELVWNGHSVQSITYTLQVESDARVNKTNVEGLQSERKISTDLVLIIVFAALFAIAILVSAIFIYKWRVLKAKRAENESPYSSFHSNPAFDSTGRRDGNGMKSNAGAGEPPSLAPQLPPRPLQRAEDEFAMDSAGYFVPSATQDLPSDENVLPLKDSTFHAARERLQGSRQSDAYLHPTSDDPGLANYLHPIFKSDDPPTTGESNDYLHLINTSDDLPSTGESDNYLHPIYKPHDPPTSGESDNYLHPVYKPHDPATSGESDNYLHPVYKPHDPATSGESDNYLHPVYKPDDPPTSGE